MDSIVTVRRGFAVFVLMTLIVTAAGGLAPSTDTSASTTSWTAYVGNFGSVTPIDTATNTAESAITFGQSLNGIAITPNRKTAYVSNLGPDFTVTPIDTATNTAGSAITVGNDPDGIAI